jgi:hypothetical protein
MNHSSHTGLRKPDTTALEGRAGSTSVNISTGCAAKGAGSMPQRIAWLRFKEWWIPGRARVVFIRYVHASDAVSVDSNEHALTPVPGAQGASRKYNRPCGVAAGLQVR